MHIVPVSWNITIYGEKEIIQRILKLLLWYVLNGKLLQEQAIPERIDLVSKAFLGLMKLMSTR